MNTLGGEYRRWKEKLPSELLRLKDQVESLMAVLPETAEGSER